MLRYMRRKYERERSNIAVGCDYAEWRRAKDWTQAWMDQITLATVTYIRDTRRRTDTA
jgi:hypothetical protein